MSDGLKDCADFVYGGTALPVPAAIPGIPQAVIRVAQEHTPEPEDFFGLPRPQAGVFKPGDDSTATR
jgi:hypothetical protein